MWRAVPSSIAALALFSSVAAAQSPCTTDAARVVSEVYRHTLERNPDRGAQTWVRQLDRGQLSVKELVRSVAKSPEHMQRFGQAEPGEGQPYQRAVATLYRHVLGRQPDSNGLRNWTRIAQRRGLEPVRPVRRLQDIRSRCRLPPLFVAALGPRDAVRRGYSRDRVHQRDRRPARGAAGERGTERDRLLRSHRRVHARRERRDSRPGRRSRGKRHP